MAAEPGAGEAVSFKPEEVPHIRVWKYAKLIRDDVLNKHRARKDHDALECGGPHFAPEFLEYLAHNWRDVNLIASFVMSPAFPGSVDAGEQQSMWEIAAGSVGRFSDPSNVLTPAIAAKCKEDASLGRCVFCDKLWWTVLQRHSHIPTAKFPSVLRINVGCPHVCHYNCWMRVEQEARACNDPSLFQCPLCTEGHFGLAAEAFAPITNDTLRLARIYAWFADRVICQCENAVHNVALKPKQTGAGRHSQISHDYDVSCSYFRATEGFLGSDASSNRSQPRSGTGCYRCMAGNVCPCVHVHMAVNVPPSDLVEYLRDGEAGIATAEGSTTATNASAASSVSARFGSAALSVASAGPYASSRTVPGAIVGTHAAKSQEECRKCLYEALDEARRWECGTESSAPSRVDSGTVSEPFDLGEVVLPTPVRGKWVQVRCTE